MKEVFLMTSNTLFQDFANKNKIIQCMRDLPIRPISRNTVKE